MSDTFFESERIESEGLIKNFLIRGEKLITLWTLSFIFYVLGAFMVFYTLVNGFMIPVNGEGGFILGKFVWLLCMTIICFVPFWASDLFFSRRMFALMEVYEREHFQCDEDFEEFKKMKVILKKIEMNSAWCFLFLPIGLLGLLYKFEWWNKYYRFYKMYGGWKVVYENKEMSYTPASEIPELIEMKARDEKKGVFSQSDFYDEEVILDSEDELEEGIEDDMMEEQDAEFNNRVDGNEEESDSEETNSGL